MTIIIAPTNIQTLRETGHFSQNQRFWEVQFHVRRIYNHVEYHRYDTCPKYDANPQFQTRQTYNPIWNCAYTDIYGFYILNCYIDCEKYF